MTDIPTGGDEQLVGEFDADTATFRVTSWVGGPAGTARIEPVEGITVDVDYAQPDVLSELILDSPGDFGLRGLDPRAERFLEAYLGRMALVRLAELGTPKARGRRVILSDRDDYDRRPRRPGRRPGPPVREQVGRIALALEAAAADGTDDARQAAYLVEAAALAAALRDVIAPDRLSLVASDAAAVVDQLVGAALDGDLLPSDAQRLSRMCATAADVSDGEAAHALRSAGEELLRGPRSAMADYSAAPTPAAAMPMAQRELRTVEELRLPVVVPFEGHVTPAATFTHHNEVTVELGYVSVPSAAWARAFDRRDATLLALGPVATAPDGSVISRLFVPAGFRGADLLIDVTDEPASPPNSPERLALNAALDAGRRACAFERVGDRVRAEREWHRCARAWREVGDTTRSGLAQQYAAGAADIGTGPRNRRRPSRPLVGDGL